MSATENFPWRRLMAGAFALGGITPDLFWSLTPGELCCLLSGTHPLEAAGHMTRRRLDDLHTRYPDTSPNTSPNTPANPSPKKSHA